MHTATIVHKTKAKWFLATNELYDSALPAPFIDWSDLMRGLNGGTKYQRAHLLRSTQELVEALIAFPSSKGRQRLANSGVIAGTVLNWYWEIRHFVRWITAHGFWTFSSLTPEDVRSYLEHRRLLVSGKAISLNTYRARVNVIKRMWLLRDHYVSPLHVDPDVLDLRLPGKTKSTWVALDESSALPLIGDAINWIERFGELLVLVSEELWNISEKVGISRHQRSKAITAMYCRLDTLPVVAELRRELGMPDVTTYRVLRETSSLMTGACVVVILFLVGMRIGELARLDYDCLDEALMGAPPGAVGLHGIAAKQGGRSRMWIACDEVRLAVSTVLRINAVARGNAKTRPLWLTHRTGNFFRARHSLKRMTSGSLTAVMQRFALSDFRSQECAIRRIHPHVARKTFARFVVRRDKRALGPLSRHYGHVSASITDGVYVGNDIELEKLLSEESRRDLKEALTDLVASCNVGGKAGDTVTTLKSSAPHFHGRKGLERLVEKLIADGVQLAPCDWGYCIYSRAFSACRGDDRGPNEVNRSAEVCAGCTNFAVTEKHRSYWEERVVRDEEFLRKEGNIPQSVEWVTRRLEGSKRILKDLLPLQLVNQKP